VTLAHAMALESSYVQAEMIAATEFQQLAGEYQVSGVPHTAINKNAGQMIGSGPEVMLLEEITKVVND